MYDKFPFPGAVGPAAQMPGGRNGQLLRVTTHAADGLGSLKAAIETPGPPTSAGSVTLPVE